VVRLDREPVLGAQATYETREVGASDLDDSSAHFAHEVRMSLFREVVDGAAVPEVDMLDDAELLEGLEAAIDGGSMNVGMLGLHRDGEFVGGDVRLCRQQGTDDRSPRARNSSAVLA
jgi:hypothetical protein